MNGKTFKSVFTDPAFLMTLIITFQFFILILVFSYYKSNMDTEAKSVILQTYVIAFTASWGFWIGGVSKEQQLMGAAPRPLLPEKIEPEPPQPEPPK